MSGLVPLFASAPLCKIIVNDVPIAYAVGLSVNVGVNLSEIRVLGEFEVQSIEPLAMMPVTGSFQVIRLLTSKARATTETKARAQANTFVLAQNEITSGAQGQQFQDVSTGSYSGTDTGKGGLTGSSDLARHLDPRTILLSKSFDIQIQMKVPTVSADGKVTKDDSKLATFMEIKDCRLSAGSGSLSPGALLTESVEFQGILAVRYKGQQTAPEPQETSGVKVTDLG